MPDKNKEDIQELINEVAEIKNTDYETFLMIKYIVKGVNLAQKYRIEQTKKFIS
jgi:1,2-phenylacetyl-CoA epoxidase catalytic subunit